MTSIIDSDTAHYESEPDFLGHLRFSAGIDLGRWISVAAGIGWAADLSPASRPTRLTGNWMQHSHFGGRLQDWPAFHLSFRAGTYGSSPKD